MPPRSIRAVAASGVDSSPSASLTSPRAPEAERRGEQEFEVPHWTSREGSVSHSHQGCQVGIAKSALLLAELETAFSAFGNPGQFRQCLHPALQVGLKRPSPSWSFVPCVDNGRDAPLSSQHDRLTIIRSSSTRQTLGFPIRIVLLARKEGIADVAEVLAALAIPSRIFEEEERPQSNEYAVVALVVSSGGAGLILIYSLASKESELRNEHQERVPAGTCCCRHEETSANYHESSARLVRTSAALLVEHDARRRREYSCAGPKDFLMRLHKQALED
ncbi:hypothetical protein FA95DRAFT_1610365 [Auriscalpium vulgare]|uniref:Uncharacterized protein n=1 Tax=Auriscalpium vulgare TaxID=40419 RepID=A0ACB8RF47_9AGAM|nr:hypothetical protein FA95DRAFT_1610365 [Auriscalpium vulgare]